MGLPMLVRSLFALCFFATTLIVVIACSAASPPPATKVSVEISDRASESEMAEVAVGIESITTDDFRCDSSEITPTHGLFDCVARSDKSWASFDCAFSRGEPQPYEMVCTTYGRFEQGDDTACKLDEDRNFDWITSYTIDCFGPSDSIQCRVLHYREGYRESYPGTEPYEVNCDREE